MRSGLMFHCPLALLFSVALKDGGRNCLLLQKRRPSKFYGTTAIPSCSGYLAFLPIFRHPVHKMGEEPPQRLLALERCEMRCACKAPDAYLELHQVIYYSFL